MNFLSFLRFFCFLAYVFMAGFVIYKNSKSLLNKICSGIMACLSIWAFADIFASNSVITKDAAMLFQNISSIGWISISSFILCFSLALSNKEKLLKSKILIFIIFIIPLFFIYKQWTNCLMTGPVQQSYGWAYTWTDTIWTYLFYVYYISFTLLSIYFGYRHWKITEKLFEKKQSTIIVTCVSIGLVGGTISDVLIPELNIQNIPPLANVFYLICIIPFIYAIIKYRFMTITPANAAENIISSIEEFLFLLNPEGIILNVNKAILDSLKYSKKELEGKSVEMLFSKGSLKRGLLEKITKGEIVKNYEVDFLTKNGKEIPVLFSSSPLKDESSVGRGNISGIIFIAHDITERKQIEENIKKHVIELERSNKELEQLTYIVSHDLREPLHMISGFTQLLAENYKEQLCMEAQEYIKLIIIGADKMQQLIEDVLSYSRLSTKSEPFTDVDMSAVLEKVITILSVKIKESNALITYNKLPVIKACKGQMFQLFQNLLTNAIKFCNVQPRIYISAKEDNKQWIFSVNDNGIGIEQQYFEKIFQIFQKLHAEGKYSGTGIGLCICKRIVELHGGSIWVESEINNGSVFYFTLPKKQN